MTTVPSLQQIVAFRLGDDLFAADVFCVERVLRYVAPRAIPNVPAWLTGVVDYRDRVVPVIDLRTRFELPRRAEQPDTRILVVQVEGEWIGLIVDAVTEVTAVDPAAVQPPPPLFRGLAGTYVRGVVRRGEALVVVLDTARLVSTNDRLVLERARRTDDDGAAA